MRSSYTSKELDVIMGHSLVIINPAVRHLESLMVVCFGCVSAGLSGQHVAIRLYNRHLKKDVELQVADLFPITPDGEPMFARPKSKCN